MNLRRCVNYNISCYLSFKESKMIANEANLDATEVEMKTINHDFRDVDEVQEEVVRTKR